MPCIRSDTRAYVVRRRSKSCARRLRSGHDGHTGDGAGTVHSARASAAALAHAQRELSRLEARHARSIDDLVVPTPWKDTPTSRTKRYRISHLPSTLVVGHGLPASHAGRIEALRFEHDLAFVAGRRDLEAALAIEFQRFPVVGLDVQADVADCLAALILQSNDQADVSFVAPINPLLYKHTPTFII